MRLATTILVFSIAALSALGLVMIYSASPGIPEARNARYLIGQPVWCGLGLIAFLATSATNYRWLKKYDWLPWTLLAIAVVLLALTLVPHVGVKLKGARRWLGTGPWRFQPSEMAKIVLIIMLAYYGERYQRFMPTFLKGLIIPGMIVSSIIGLMFLEPDVGTSMLLAVVSCLMLVIAGIRLWYILPPILIGSIALGYFLYTNPVRSERIYSWLHLEETKLDKGHQAYQSIVALGSGGWTGVGLGDGRQKLGFVPEHHTDFILSVIGEELGLAATLGVVLGFLAILISGTYIAWHARDTFGMLLASGLTFLIALQAIINIGVVTSALPNKGLSLPFISYGGSNLVVMFTGIGLLISVARQALGPRSLLENPFEAPGVASTLIS
jgi:cell division protein FtsW